jgi:hypothetical protein
MMTLRPKVQEHIVEILGHGSLGEHTESYFIDMEYCECNLDEYIRGMPRSEIPIPALMTYATAIKEDIYPF